MSLIILLLFQFGGCLNKMNNAIGFYGKLLNFDDAERLGACLWGTLVSLPKGKAPMCVPLGASPAPTGWKLSSSPN